MGEADAGGGDQQVAAALHAEQHALVGQHDRRARSDRLSARQGNFEPAAQREVALVAAQVHVLERNGVVHVVEPAQHLVERRHLPAQREQLGAEGARIELQLAPRRRLAHAAGLRMTNIVERHNAPGAIERSSNTSTGAPPARAASSNTSGCGSTCLVPYGSGETGGGAAAA